MTDNIGKMIFNAITLSFPNENERLFREKYFINSLYYFRIAYLLVVFLFAIFGFIDFYMAQEHLIFFFTIRFGIILPLLLVGFLLSFTKQFEKYWQALLFASFVIVGHGMGLFILKLPENYVYITGLVLVLFAGFFLIKLRFFMACLAAWLILIVFNIELLTFSNPTNIDLISYNLLLGTANIVGMVASYNVELFARKDFYLHRVLDQQKTEITYINKNLEQIVDERTIELTKAKEKAEQSDKLKTSLHENMSHEIRTPLNSIMGFSSLLPGEDDKATQAKYVEIINRNSDQLVQIIDDIVLYSSLQNNFLNSYPTKFQIENILSEVAASFDIPFKKDNVEFIIEPIPSEVSTISTDYEKLFQVINNLVSNAFKYTHKGEIRLGVEKVERLLKFHISDTGIGVPDGEQTQIFDRFFRGSNVNQAKTQGTGLGLSIVKELVTLLGGEIWVESEEGRGSTFFFTIRCELIGIETVSIE